MTTTNGDNPLDLNPRDFGAPAQMRDLERAFGATLAHFGLSQGDLDLEHPLNQLGDAAIALAGSTYAAGVRVGAAAEQFRRAMTAD
jgi:hypothetical protein